MTSCLLNRNLTKSSFCGYSLKQISDIFLANYEHVGTELTTQGGGAVSGYTVSNITGDTTFYRIEPAKDTASYNDDLVIGGNGSKYRNHVLNFSFNSAYDERVASVLDALSLGRFVAVLKLSDGSAVMMGRLTGLEATAASSLSEAAADGANGLQITLGCNTTEPVLPVSPEVLQKIMNSIGEDGAEVEGGSDENGSTSGGGTGNNPL